jgi:hypothetical protein
MLPLAPPPLLLLLPLLLPLLLFEQQLQLCVYAVSGPQHLPIAPSRLL